MKVLSLWQPWATLFAHGQKRIETRSWAYHGPLPTILAVHAAKKWDNALAGMTGTEPFASALLCCGYADHQRVTVESLPFGCIIGLVRLIGCQGTDVVRPDITAQEKAFGDYSSRRFAWVCDRFGPLTPIPLRGRQGLFNWEPPPEIEDAAAILLR